jgi:hypothetical protein
VGTAPAVPSAVASVSAVQVLLQEEVVQEVPAPFPSDEVDLVLLLEEEEVVVVLARLVVLSRYINISADKRKKETNLPGLGLGPLLFLLFPFLYFLDLKR